MDNYTKYKLAKEVMARTMAIACSNGFDPNDPVIAELICEERELRRFNENVIDKILNVYAPLINLGEQNG